MTNERTKASEIASRYINMTNRPVFLTGKAGTGKTTFLHEIVHSTHKNTVIAAPTGIAAINAGGVTLHSLFQLPFGCFVPDSRYSPPQGNVQVNTPMTVISQTKINKQKKKLLRETDLLIIDEVSMLRADLLDCIDVVLKNVRRSDVPFGGLQILFIGDLLQLPPVVKNEEWQHLSPYYKSPFFYEAGSLKAANLVYIEFDKVFRQTDEHFINLLNKFRDNRVEQADIEEINKQYRPDFKPGPDEGYVLLTTHNHAADSLNQENLIKLQEKTYRYGAKVTGDFGEHMFPAHETLVLKKGAQVMFVKNDPTGQQRFFNGKIGNVSYISSSEITVSFTDGTNDVDVEPYLWENIKYVIDKNSNTVEESTIGSFEQYPIKLAWAITVHKSQGLTFNKAILDLSRAFAPGQIYVALSRLTSLDGLVLSAPVPLKNFGAVSGLEEFGERRQSVDTLQEQFAKASNDYFATAAQKAFDFHETAATFYEHVLTYDKSDASSPKQKYRPWAVDFHKTLLQIKEVGDKFINQVKNISLSAESELLNVLTERVKKAEAYFKDQLEGPSNTLASHLDKVRVEKGMKKYVGELTKLNKALSFKTQEIEKALSLLEHAGAGKELTREEVPKVKPGPVKEEVSKVPSRDISFDLFEQSSSIEEVASQRGMAVSTIQGHLAHFVSTGQLAVGRVMDEAKIADILTVHDTLETPSFNAIKSKLGDEYSYADIRFAIAHRNSQEKTD